MFDNGQISSDNFDWQIKSRKKTTKLKQNKTKDRTIQYECLQERHNVLEKTPQNYCITQLSCLYNHGHDSQHI